MVLDLHKHVGSLSLATPIFVRELGRYIVHHGKSRPMLPGRTTTHSGRWAPAFEVIISWFQTCFNVDIV